MIKSRIAETRQHRVKYFLYNTTIVVQRFLSFVSENIMKDKYDFNNVVIKDYLKKNKNESFYL